MGIPRNLTPHESGLTSPSKGDLMNLLRTGTRPDGAHVDPNKMPYRVFGEMTETEVGAIYLFLHQLPARPFGGR